MKVAVVCGMQEELLQNPWCAGMESRLYRYLNERGEYDRVVYAWYDESVIGEVSGGEVNYEMRLPWFAEGTMWVGEGFKTGECTISLQESNDTPEGVIDVLRGYSDEKVECDLMGIDYRMVMYGLCDKLNRLPAVKCRVRQDWSIGWRYGVGDLQDH